MFTNIDWHIQYLQEKEGKGGGGGEKKICRKNQHW